MHETHRRAARTAELAENLLAVRQRMAQACRVAGRDPAEVTMIAVTKTFPASDVELLAELGLVDVGENKDQEARGKAARFPALRWHFLGRLQRNKCRSVARYAHSVHSVDRLSLVSALATAAQHRLDNPLGVFIQINLDTAGSADVSRSDHEIKLDPTRRRGGVLPHEMRELAAHISSHRQLELRGVMGIAPHGGDAKAAFSQLARLSKELQESFGAATAVSAGMSGDLEIAIQAGATHVRVGSALLGIR